MSNQDKKLEHILDLRERQQSIYDEFSEPTIILFADLTDSTSYKFDNYLPEGIARAYEHNTLVSELIDSYGGKVLKWLGDGVLACFKNPSSDTCSKAVLASIDILRAFQANNENLPSVHQIHTRIGIHFGEKVFWSKNTDVLGMDVDITARIQSMCRPDQILISNDFFEKCDFSIIRSELKLKKDRDISKVYIEEATLKGVKNPLTLHSILWDLEICSDHKPPEMDISLQKLQSVIAKKDFIKIEKAAKSEAWIMSPTLEHDLHFAKDDVVENMKKGVKYQYIVPDTVEIRTTIKRLRKHWKLSGIEIRPSDPECMAFFTLLPPPCVLNTVLVFDPYSQDSRAIVMPPTNALFPPQNYPYGILISDFHGVNYYTGFFEELLRIDCAKKADIT